MRTARCAVLALIVPVAVGCAMHRGVEAHMLEDQSTVRARTSGFAPAAARDPSALPEEPHSSDPRAARFEMESDRERGAAQGVEPSPDRARPLAEEPRR